MRSRRPSCGDGSLLYVVGVAPQSEAQTYDPAFRRVLSRFRSATDTQPRHTEAAAFASGFGAQAAGLNRRSLGRG